MIPKGFTNAVSTGGATTIEVIGDVDSPTTVAVAQSIAQRYATGVGTSTLAGLVALNTGVITVDEVAGVATQVADKPPLVETDPITVGSNQLDPTTSLTAGLAVFFIFFTAGLPLLSVIEERNQATLDRLLAAPIPAASIRAGKTVASILIGVIALVSLMISSHFLMGANWGPPAGTLLLATAVVISVSGIMMLAGSKARTAEQAGNLQGVVAVVLGILGGAFVPLSTSQSGVLHTLQKLTPNGQFLDALAALKNGGLISALPEVAALLLIGAVTGAIGLWLSRSVMR